MWEAWSAEFHQKIGKSLIYHAASVIYHLSSLEETGHYIYCAAR